MKQSDAEKACRLEELLEFQAAVQEQNVRITILQMAMKAAVGEDQAQVMGLAERMIAFVYGETVQ